MNLKTLLIISTFIIYANNIYSQNSKIPHKRKSAMNIDTTIYLADKTEKKAGFKGGDSLLVKFFKHNFKSGDNLNTQTTISTEVCFVVEKNGSRTYYPIPKRIYDLDENKWLRDTALSIIKKMPTFEPAIIKGKKVRSSTCIYVFICSNKEIFVLNQALIPYSDNCHDCSYGPDNPCSSDTIEVINFAEQMPEFSGGKDSMELFIRQNLIYPKNAKESNVEGRVQIQFVVWSDGKISQIKALTRKGWGLEEEAIRVIKMMPNWKPGKQNGKVVTVRFSMPIVFKLPK